MPEPTTGSEPHSIAVDQSAATSPPAAESSAGSPEIVILPDEGSVSLAAARRIADTLAGAVEDRGRADFATTGGSVPLGIYPLLASSPLRESVPWESVHLWWGDDRFVPRDHPDSNVRPVDDLLVHGPARSGESGVGASGSDTDLAGAPGVFLPNAQVHPFPCTQAIAEGRGADWCVARYTDELRTAVRLEHGWPVFDLVLLGIGPDGHIMSVFPGSPALSSRQWAIAIPAPTHVSPHVPRVTLNPTVLTVARQVVVMAHGTGKADVLGRIIGGDRNPRFLPAQLALRSNAVWFLDEAAAAAVPR